MSSDGEREALAAALKRAIHVRAGSERAAAPLKTGGAGSSSISFNAPLLRAIRAGKKTQTRRPVRPAPACVIDNVPRLADGTPVPPIAHCGGTLWVRESWARVGNGFVYAADRPHPPGVRWSSSRFMPRDAARLMLRVESVAVERLAAIDDAGAVAEGAASDPSAMFGSRVWFLALWDSIYGDGAFASANDPWVWAITFKRVDSASGL